MKIGILGYRLKLALFLKSKVYDIFMIILIVCYTILIFLFFGLEDTTFFAQGSDSTIFYIIELCILGIFCIEIITYILTFHCLYFMDMWNIFDIVIIMISIVFVLLDIFVQNTALSAFLKIRGIFRLVRIFILIRKLNALRVKRD
jgi:hypothetical protein